MAEPKTKPSGEDVGALLDAVKRLSDIDLDVLRELLRASVRCTTAPL